MELKDLVGEHVLTACDHDSEHEGDGGAILFTLDGITYRVTEDPKDGYRSSMRDIEVSGQILKNVFAPCRVLARYIDGQRNYASSNDLLECIDVVTGKSVLVVGTESTDDYYPRYVADFSPENMAANAVSK